MFYYTSEGKQQPEDPLLTWRFWNLGRCEMGPQFHESRSSREIKLQNESCQMGGREVIRR